MSPPPSLRWDKTFGLRSSPSSCPSASVTDLSRIKSTAWILRGHHRWAREACTSAEAAARPGLLRSLLYADRSRRNSTWKRRTLCATNKKRTALESRASQHLFSKAQGLRNEIHSSTKYFQIKLHCIRLISGKTVPSPHCHQISGVHNLAGEADSGKAVISHNPWEERYSCHFAIHDGIGEAWLVVSPLDKVREDTPVDPPSML